MWHLLDMGWLVKSTVCSLLARCLSSYIQCAFMTTSKYAELFHLSLSYNFILTELFVFSWGFRARQCFMKSIINTVAVISLGLQFWPNSSAQWAYGANLDMVEITSPLNPPPFPPPRLNVDEQRRINVWDVWKCLCLILNRVQVRCCCGIKKSANKS